MRSKTRSSTLNTSREGCGEKTGENSTDECVSGQDELMAQTDINTIEKSLSD